MCFDVLTGYLKAPNDDFDEETHSAGADGPVRATIVTTLVHRSRSAEHWRGEAVSLEGADLRGVDFHRAMLSGANLSRVDLRFANLVGLP